MKVLGTEDNFLGIEDPSLYQYDSSKVLIQSFPYEHTSSYLQGSNIGPEEILKASHYVEFYDEETDHEAFRKTGICTLVPYEIGGRVNKEAIDFLYQQTKVHIGNGKFVVTLGAEHSIAVSMVKAYQDKYPNLKCLQIDAHSDLRQAYQDNPYSHASALARVFDLGVPLTQVGIRAQCIEESQLIKNNPDKIHTWYAHMVHSTPNWIDRVVDTLQGAPVYITIDADGFDPAVMPAVGTAEPNGLSWHQGTQLLKKVAEKCNVVGFDIVEIAPKEGEILTQFNCAKLLYKFISYLSFYNKI
ncbi:MAG: agmatinase [Bacteroidia bacterium]|nr:agmatinase [Bacteroidia bacterium]MCO5253174.1 agmatinase [Bacteroidota bacterium]MCZ2128785.1 agmatinase [Bacteroidia bacterium]